MKKAIRIIALYLCFMMLVSQLAACSKSADAPVIPSDESEEIDPFKINYPSVFASSLKFELKDSDLENYESKLIAVKELYNKNAVGEEEFKIALYELLSLGAIIETQRDIAYMQYYYDMSSANWDNYLYAYDMYTQAHGLFWEFYNESKEGSNALFDVFYEVVKSEFGENLLTSQPQTDFYAQQMKGFEGQYNSLKSSDASDQAIFDVYIQYMKAAQGYAKSYGFKNYYEYASKNVFYRKDTKTERDILRQYTKQYLIPLYKELRASSKEFDSKLSKSNYNLSIKYLSESYKSFSENYLTSYFSSLPSTAEKAMSGAFGKDRVLIGDNENSYMSAMVYMVGDTPICYFHEDDTTLDTMSHELGHYYAHTVSDCAYYSYDLRETHSSANNMLLYSYLSNKLNNKAFKSAELYSVYNWVYQIIVSVIKDEFDEIIYTSDPSTLTVYDFERIMSELIEKYGASELSSNIVDQLMTYWKRLGITYPMSNYCYATANIASLQIYIDSKDNYAKASEVYKNIVEKPLNGGDYISTITGAGLTTPYDEQTYIKLSRLKELY